MEKMRLFIRCARFMLPYYGNTGDSYREDGSWNKLSGMNWLSRTYIFYNATYWRRVAIKKRRKFDEQDLRTFLDANEKYNIKKDISKFNLFLENESKRLK